MKQYDHVTSWNIYGLWMCKNFLLVDKIGDISQSGHNAFPEQNIWAEDKSEHWE